MHKIVTIGLYKPTHPLTEYTSSGLVSTCLVWYMEGNLNWSFFYGTLISDRYAHVLEGPMSDFLDECVSLRDLSQMWFQHDGAPTHKSLKPRTVLAMTFKNNIIGYGGLVEWPPRSSDLNPLVYFLCFFFFVVVVVF